LRRQAGDHITIQRETVVFDHSAPYRLDVERFEAYLRAAAAGGGAAHLRAATELYAGDLLAGFAVRDAPAFEDWLAGERERLRRLALQALHALAVYHSDRAEHLAASAVLGRLLALDPWREDAHRQLMLVLAGSGQRDAALAQYE
ncbi:bacterial transcriptional activator domain-containing protein, partial [Xanthomonas citri pv. citri]